MFTGNGLSRIRSFYSSSKLNLPVLKSNTEQSNQGNIIILKFYFFESVKVLGILSKSNARVNVFVDFRARQIKMWICVR